VEQQNRNKRFLKSYLKDQRKMMIELEKKEKFITTKGLEKRDSLYNNINDLS
jgi:hypothetical protein